MLSETLAELGFVTTILMPFSIMTNMVSKTTEGITATFAKKLDLDRVGEKLAKSVTESMR